MISHTLYTTSHTWKHKSYICHLTLYIWHYIHCICVIKLRVSIAFYPLYVCHYTLYVWQKILYAWHHMNTLWHHTHIGMTSHPVYLWHHVQYIWSHPYCFMKTKRLYLASHPLYLTSQQLHLYGHRRSNNAFKTIMEVFPLGTRKTTYTPYITPNSDFLTSISVFRTLQTLHSWHQISHTWHHIHGLWHHIPYTCDITATLSVT